MSTLDSSEALEQCLERSMSSPIFIFKHSTRCPVSASARGEVASYAASSGEGAAPVYINYVVENRSVSDEIASIMGVKHESPQLFLVHERQPIWHCSHGAIRSDAMARAYQKAAKKNEN